MNIMNSKIVPVIGLVVVVALVGFLFRDQFLADRQASLLSPGAQFKQGEMCELGWGRPKDTPAAINWYLYAAESDHAEAQFRLANLYYAGQRVEQDFQEALKWYLRAANNGHVDAEYQLGRMYQLGEGVPVDRVEAEKWFSLAREQGHGKVPSNPG